MEPEKKEKLRPSRRKSRGDALIVEASVKTTYAALLRKVREDLDLKELGENVVKTRRTQKGEMIFELKKDPAVKSLDYRELVAKSLGSDANVRALSQEVVIECRNLDAVTTEEELRFALTEQCKLDVPVQIRLTFLSP